MARKKKRSRIRRKFSAAQLAAQRKFAARWGGKKTARRRKSTRTARRSPAPAGVPTMARKKKRTGRRRSVAAKIKRRSGRRGRAIGRGLGKFSGPLTLAGGVVAGGIAAPFITNLAAKQVPQLGTLIDSPIGSLVANGLVGYFTGKVARRFVGPQIASGIVAGSLVAPIMALIGPTLNNLLAGVGGGGVSGMGYYDARDDGMGLLPSADPRDDGMGDYGNVNTYAQPSFDGVTY